MKLAFPYDHRDGIAQWGERDLYEWVTDIFECPSVRIGPGCTNDVRNHVEKEFIREGWARDVKLDQDLKLNVFAQKDDLAFQLQTGNMSRAPYDLLKLQYLFQSGRIEAAALAVPTKDAARAIGENIANADRIVRELQLFDRVITVPILLIAFD
ncbi:MAG: restriction endonuclease [Marivibrio sp.]|uniref:BglII/BstYI family type II restriction endonuclease n=1 Tax=Marivibrio sp. TaxID=2039719 RepID=UPI0032EBB52A